MMRVFGYKKADFTTDQGVEITGYKRLHRDGHQPQVRGGFLGRTGIPHRRQDCEGQHRPRSSCEY